MPRGGLTAPFLTSRPPAQLLAQHGQQLLGLAHKVPPVHTGSPGQEQLNLASPPSLPTRVGVNACFGLDLKGPLKKSLGQKGWVCCSTDEGEPERQASSPATAATTSFPVSLLSHRTYEGTEAQSVQGPSLGPTAEPGLELAG